MFRTYGTELSPKSKDHQKLFSDKLHHSSALWGLTNIQRRYRGGLRFARFEEVAFQCFFKLIQNLLKKTLKKLLKHIK